MLGMSGRRADRSLEIAAGIECSSRMLAVASFTPPAFKVMTSCRQSICINEQALHAGVCLDGTLQSWVNKRRALCSADWQTWDVAKLRTDG